MNKSKELTKNTIIIFIGVFFTKIIQYFLLPVYTGYLSTSEYGTVDLFNTIVLLICPIISLQIEQGIFRFLINKRNDIKSQKELISSSFIFVIISSLICLVIMLIIAPFIKNEYKWFVVLNIFSTYFSSYLMQVSRGLGNNKAYSMSGFITALITIIFNIIFLACIGLKIDGMLLGSFIGYTICIIYLFMRLKIYTYLGIKYIKFEHLKKMLKYSLPMIPNTLSWWIFSSSDRIVISSFLGVAANGILSIAYKFSNIIIVIYNVFNLSITETISVHINENDIEDFFNNIFNKVCNIFTSIGIIMISCLSIAFYILVNESYNGAYVLLPIAIFASVFQVYSGILGTIYIAKKNTKSIAITSILAAIINIVIDLLLVNIIGLYAAVISTVASFIVLFIYRLFDVNKKYFNVNIENNVIINVILMLIVVIPLFYINNLYIKIINIIISTIIMIGFNKKSFKYFVKLFKKENKIK